MSDRIQISITATDGASRVFGQVAQGADRMGQSLDKAERSATRFNAAGAAIGAVIGASLGVLSDAARIANEADVSQERLRASIEATGATFEEYADQIEAAGDAAVQMAFDDEAAADAISFLTQATGDAATAINDLGLVMDIARGRGISLAEAARIVAAAEQERFTALRRIGIVLDENATKEEAIAALQAKYAGQAESYAETSGAALERLGQQFENVLENVGASTGQFQSLLMVLPGLSAGFTAAAAAAGAFNQALGLSRLAAVPAIGAIGGVTLGLAAVGYMLANPEPTGIGKDVPFFEILNTEAQGLQLTLDRLNQTGNTYAIETGRQSGQIVSDLTALVQRQHELNYLIENDTTATAQQTRAWNNELAIVTDQLGMVGDGVYQVSNLTNDLNTILGYSGEGAGLAADELGRLNDEFRGDDLTPMEYVNAVHGLAVNLDELDELAANGALSLDQTTAATERLTDATYESLGSQETYNDLLEARALYAEILAEAQANLTASFNDVTSAVMATTTALESGFRVAVGNTDAIAKQSQSVADWAVALGGAIEHVDEWGNSLGWWSRMDEVVTGWGSTLSAATLSLDDYNAANEAFGDIARENAEIQQNIAVIQAQQAPIIAELMAQQENYLQSVAEMEPAQQRFTLAMMDSATAAQALELATSLLGENGDVFAPMVESAANLNPYLAEILDQMDIIEQQPDGTWKVVADVADAQSDLDRLVDVTERLAFTNILIAVDFDVERAREEFREAFGYEYGSDPIPLDVPVDPNFLIPDGALPTFDIETGEPIPVDVPVEPTYTEAGGGVTTFYPTVVPEAEPVDVDVPVNPVWVWESATFGDGTGGPSPFGDLGPVVVPIEADTTGFQGGIDSVQTQVGEAATWTSSPNIGIVTGEFDSGIDTVHSSLDNINVATVNPTVGINTGDFDAGAAAVGSSLSTLDSSTATPTINVNDNASGAIYAAIGALNQLDGMVANSYINTYVTTISSFIGSGTSPLGNGHGGIAGYAAGGVVAEMAEWGPELLHFPNGGVALARNRGIYTVPQGTYVDTAPATAYKLGSNIGVTVNINGPSSWDDAAAQVSRKIVPAIARAIREHERSLGSY